MNRWNWEQVEEKVRELAPQAKSLLELSSLVSTDMGRVMPQATLQRWAAKFMGGPVDYDAFLARLGITKDEEQFSELAQCLLGRLRRKREEPKSLIHLADLLDASPKRVTAAAQELRAAGYNIQIPEEQPIIFMPSEPETGRGLPPIPASEYVGTDDWIRYGVVSETHLCNMNARLDVLDCLYNVFEREGIQVVLHAGNLVDGECRLNRHELVVAGLEHQIGYAAEHYPKREGIQTQFITAADHEGWWTKIGFDVGRHMGNSFDELGRGDLVWIGHIERDIALSEKNPETILRIIHPGGAGAYATSYPIQKLVESFQGGEKPRVLVCGHHHKYDTGFPRECWSLQPGCVCDQTTFLRTRRISVMVGGCILEIKLASDGSVARVRHEWMPFYDRGFYKSWSFRKTA